MKIFEILIIALKSVAVVTGFGMIMGLLMGLPFMLKQYQYSVKIIYFVLLIFGGPLYIMPNKLLLRKKYVIGLLLTVSSAFVIITSIEILLNIAANNKKYMLYCLYFVCCVSAPSSLLLELWYQNPDS